MFRRPGHARRSGLKQALGSCVRNGPGSCDVPFVGKRPGRHMSAGCGDDVVADPVGMIVRLVADVEPGLDIEHIREVVAALGAGRAKLRRLAQALGDEPLLLATGGPPVPWAVGQLLLGLRAAGADSIAAPRCGDCGRSVSYQISRRGCLICSPCRDTPQTCVKCGNQRRVSTRDRHGHPRCAECPDLDGDPMKLLVQVVVGIDPELDPQQVLTALGRATVRPAGQRRLAWSVVDNPGLLTGAGANAPVPAVLRFIEELISAGAASVARPSCPRCDRVVALSKRLDGQRVCRARAGDPRRRGSAAVPELPVQRPDQPGGLRRLPAPPPSRGAYAGRAVVPKLPPTREDDLCDLRAVLAV
jgi:hypothetical protein